MKDKTKETTALKGSVRKKMIRWPQGVFVLDALNVSTWRRHLAENIVYK